MATRPHLPLGSSRVGAPSPSLPSGGVGGGEGAVSLIFLVDLSVVPKHHLFISSLLAEPVIL